MHLRRTLRHLPIVRLMAASRLTAETTDCRPNDNVEALCVFMLGKKIEARPTWKPLPKQPVYEGAPVYTKGAEEDLFKVWKFMLLPVCAPDG